MVKKIFAAVLLTSVCIGPLSAQSGPQEAQAPPKDQISQQQDSSGANSTPSTNVGTTTPISGQPAPSGEQPKRILGIFPNFRAVSAGTQLPPLSTGGKFLLATKSSFDYSSFIQAGIASGIGQARNSNAEFGQGAAGYARRYWHWMAVGATGNYFTEAIFPSLFREDPRYYALGHGNAFHRTGYAISRLVVTKKDSGKWGPNFSEIPGNAVASGIAVFYYPHERTWVKTYQLWAGQVAVDGLSNILKEFWPDISRMLPGGNRNSNKSTSSGTTH
jgi:hypothetical protein